MNDLISIRKLSVDGYDNQQVMLQSVNWNRYIGIGGIDNNPDQLSNSNNEDEENLFVTSSDCEAIQEYENQPSEAVEELLETEDNTGFDYAKSLMKVLKNITDEKIIEYTLTLIEDFITPDIINRAKYFSENPQVNFSIQPFLTNLSSQNRYIREKSSYIAALFLSANNKPREYLDTYLTWVCEQLRMGASEAEKVVLKKNASIIANTKENSFKELNVNEEIKKSLDLTTVKATIYSLNILLANPKNRVAFNLHGGIQLLFPILKAYNGNMQLMYEVSFCIWINSFNQESISIFEAPEIFQLVTIIKSKPRIKVTRVLISCLYNIICAAKKLSKKKEQEISEIYIGLGFIKILEQLETSAQKFSNSMESNTNNTVDTDMLDDVIKLKEILVSNFRVLSTYEYYEQELKTGTLKWGVIHEEKFWKENVRKFEKKDFLSLRKLIKLLTESNDPTTLAVACSDIGYFVQYYPNGKQIANSMNAKTKVMMLLAYENQEVQRHALLSCSKMLITHWDLL